MAMTTLGLSPPIMGAETSSSLQSRADSPPNSPPQGSSNNETFDLRVDEDDDDDFDECMTVETSATSSSSGQYLLSEVTIRKQFSVRTESGKRKPQHNLDLRKHPTYKVKPRVL